MYHCNSVGLYHYQRLPMGELTSPNIAQEVMEHVLGHLEDLEMYVDNLAAFSFSWDALLVLLEKVLTILQDKRFAVNPLNSRNGFLGTLVDSTRHEAVA